MQNRKGQIALVGVEAQRSADAIVGAAAVLVEPAAGVELQPFEVLLGDDVYDAADGVSAVHRRCAVAEHFNPIDH